MKVSFWYSAVVLLGVAVMRQDDPSVLSPGQPVPGLTDQDATAFKSGKALFAKVWSPHTEFYNARSCEQCHREPAFGGASGSPFDTAFFLPDPSHPTGFKPFPWLRFKDGRPAGQRLPFGDYEVRRPQALYGLGLLEAVPVADLLKRADPQDRDKDGISGRMLKLGDQYGRFGWRASQPSLRGFVQSAFEGEMGLKVNVGEGRNHLTPEVVDQVFDTIRFLGPPRARLRGETDAGRLVFDRIGCASCHTPEWSTGSNAHPALSNKRIAPYTDMLLHDMGRGKPELTTGPKLSRREFRTAPLWGIGLVGGPYWHDGSTGTLEDAVDRHEGEGLASRDKWRKLNEADRSALLKFLKAL